MHSSLSLKRGSSMSPAKTGSNYGPIGFNDGVRVLKPGPFALELLPHTTLIILPRITAIRTGTICNTRFFHGQVHLNPDHSAFESVPLVFEPLGYTSLDPDQRWYLMDLNPGHVDWNQCPHGSSGFVAATQARREVRWIQTAGT